MIPEYLKKKLNLFHKTQNIDLIQQIENSLAGIFPKFEQCMPWGIQYASSEAIIYALVRHHCWLESKFFRDTLAEFLSHDFKIGHSDSQKLVTSVVNNLKPSEIGELDKEILEKEFIRYVFIECATSPNEAELILDLGLGKELVNRMKQAVDVVIAIHDSEATAPLLFLPEIDALISEILFEIANETKENPWAIPMARLRYQLFGYNGTNRQLYLDERLRCLFEFLLTIGAHSKIECFAQNSSKIPATPEFPKNLDVDDLLTVLCEFDLVYKTNNSNDISSIRLTEKAEEITAEAFAQEFINITTDPLSLIKSFNGHYQAEIIKAVTTPMDRLMDIALTVRPISPQCLLAVLMRISREVSVEQADDVAILILQDDPSPWMRKAACQSLAGLSIGGVMVDQLLKQVAISDPSPAVRTMAKVASLKSQSTGVMGGSGKLMENKPWQNISTP